MSLSRWFVGSSRTKSSHGFTRALAIATLFLCPTESRFTFLSYSSIPSLLKIVFASYSMRTLVSVLELMNTCSRTVASLSKAGSCSRTQILSPGLFIILPLSGSSTPDAIFKSVDFPVPLIPTTPILSLSLIYKSTLLRSTFSP
ncbi:hypothetical protein SDC9_67422 [bioreactor metagenome]|uniref:Uncharacterized protein n=1 Tax=bioreactor metagenome TaxID=1076179 RepID=A0A644Y391_9ZZZZ